MMGTVVAAAEEEFNTHVPVLIVGAGAAGLCAALAAKDLASAQKYFNLADGEISKLEKFLGH